MTDSLQLSLHHLALQGGLIAALADFAAARLVFVLGAAWLAALYLFRRRLNGVLLVRWTVMLLAAVALTFLLKGFVSDPRPFMVEHYAPLVASSRDNGFPSDHTLLAALLAASLWWLDRRLVAYFALGAVLVLLGRLAVGAHHTLDVVGSLAITLVAALIAGLLRFPPAWEAWRPMRYQS